MGLESRACAQIRVTASSGGPEAARRQTCETHLGNKQQRFLCTVDEATSALDIPETTKHPILAFAQYTINKETGQSTIVTLYAITYWMLDAQFRRDAVRGSIESTRLDL